MQVPLNFYKTWAPEMRAHAKSLGKDRFGIWGEFYVTPARYATMTGRGRDSTMLLARISQLFISSKRQENLFRTYTIRGYKLNSHTATASTREPLQNNQYTLLYIKTS